MPNDEMTIVQTCGDCGHEVGTFTVKKDNMMLMSSELVWCPGCQADRPQVRDLAGRRTAIEREQLSYAKNEAADTQLRGRSRS